MYLERDNKRIERIEGRVPVSTARKSSLISALDWSIWLYYWETQVDRKDPEARWLVDAVKMLHQGCVKLARGLRYSMHKLTYNSEGYILDMEAKDPQELAQEMLAWFARTKPKTIENMGELSFMARAIEGCLITICRIANEQATIKKTGYLPVNVSPYHAEDEFPEGAKERE